MPRFGLVRGSVVVGYDPLKPPPFVVSGYARDWANRSQSGPCVTSIVYDAEGNRIKKVAGGVTTWYLVATVNPTGYPQVVEEFTGSSPGSGTLSRVYGYGLDLLHQRQMPGNTPNFYGYDGQGSVRFLVSTNGTITDKYVYDSYGNLIPGSSSIVNTNAYRYTGEQWDADLGMYYLRARYYQPSVGRFWTRDTYEGDSSDPLSLHRYLYTQGNPVNGVDPSGHDFTAIGLTSATGIGTSLQSIYNGVVTGTGTALQATIFGAQAGVGANEILTNFILDETGLGLAVDAFNWTRGLFQDKESQEVAAYMLWREQLIATVLAAMEDNEFGEITVQLEPQCFVAGTPVATEDGLKPIEEIKQGDKVWAWNEVTDEMTLRPVLNRFIHRRSEIYEIKVGRDSFKVTGEHPFYVAGKGWTPAQDVRGGDEFVTSEDCALAVDAIEKHGGDVLVYNFEVSTDHNYYVGQEAILTHNANALRTAMNLKNPLLAAHHIVAITAGGAAKARDILRKAGIDINSAVNGVALPRNLKVKAPRGFSRATVHSVVHTAKYYEEVTRRLEAALPGTHIKVLQTIGNELKLGKFPFK